MEPRKIVVIGGSAAGAKAAAKARRLDEFAEITLIQKAPDLSMASCGYPYYIGGVFNDRRQLLCSPAGVVRDSIFFAKAKKIKAMVETEAVRIDRLGKEVQCRRVGGGEEFAVAYDTLIIATGAKAKLPPVTGCDLAGVTTLLTMADSDYLRGVCDAKRARQAVVVGGGLIGVEACEALHRAGLEVALVEALDQVLAFLDRDLAMLVENHMRSQGVRVETGTAVAGFDGREGALTGVALADGTILPCQVAVVAAGVRPNSELAKDAGLAIGASGGIVVNAFMQTSDPAIYAAGDCVEIPSRISGAPVFAPMGDLANLEGRVAGENAVCGNVVTFPGTYHTAICKVFDFSAGITGLSLTAAKKLGIQDLRAAVNAGPDKPGFMGGKLLVSRILVAGDDQRLLGFQCVGPGDVGRQVASAAMAILGKLRIADLVTADLPYAPPYSLAIDHLLVSAHIIENTLKGRMVGISVSEVWEKLRRGERPLLLDGRTPQEYEEMHLGIGEKLLPLGALRSRLEELPEDKDSEIICFCKISLRGYEMLAVLRAHGYRNVRVMEGGIMAWPYGRKK